MTLYSLSAQAREGLGGGFNERQDRASVATVEVDEDGYDDFGRKKIKARADKKAKEVGGLLCTSEAFPRCRIRWMQSRKAELNGTRKIPLSHLADSTVRTLSLGECTYYAFFISLPVF